MRNNQSKYILAGFFLSIFCGLIGLSTRLINSSELIVGALLIFAIPFLLSFFYTRNALASLGLVWINEIFFGVDGHWLEVGPLPGRGILLVFYLSFAFASRLISGKRFLLALPTDFFVILFGFFIPCWLIFYSSAIMDTPFSSAFSDGSRYFILLAYFPLRHLLKSNFNITMGWVIGGSLMLSILMLFSSIGPQPYASELYFAYSGSDVITTLESGISRTATPILVLTLSGIYLGILYLIDTRNSRYVRLLGLTLMLFSLAPLVLSFMRGPLLGIFAVTGLLVFSLFCNFRLKALAWRLLFLGIGISSLSFLVMLNFVPEGLERFNLGERSVYEFVTDDPDREEQGKRMLEAFSEAPILGKGVGVPLVGYSRGAGDDTLSFELHYHMLLYRLGGVIFFLFIFFIAWFFIEPIRLCRSSYALMSDRGKLALATLLALLTTFIAGSTNPYLVTAFTLYLIVFYLAIKWTLKEEHKDLKEIYGG